MTRLGFTWKRFFILLTSACVALVSALPIKDLFWSMVICTLVYFGVFAILSFLLLDWYVIRRRSIVEVTNSKGSGSHEDPPAF